MHEVSLVQDLFDHTDAAIRPHAASAVRLVTVRVGALSGVEGELFRTAFEGCKEERGYATARLAIVDEPAAWACEHCGAPVPADGPLACVACEGAARLTAGGDLVLLRLELEVPHV